MNKKRTLKLSPNIPIYSIFRKNIDYRLLNGIIFGFLGRGIGLFLVNSLSLKNYNVAGKYHSSSFLQFHECSRISYYNEEDTPDLGLLISFTCMMGGLFYGFSRGYWEDSPTPNPNPNPVQAEEKPITERGD